MSAHVTGPGPASLHQGLFRLQQAMAATSRGIEVMLLWICGALLVLLTGNVFLEVAIRYVVQMPLPWTEEVARFAMVWLGVLAAAAAARKGLHFSFRWGVMVLGATARRHLRLAVNGLVAVLLTVLLLQSYAFLDIVEGQTATATEISMQIPYAGLPVGFGALLMVTLLEIGDGVLALWTGQRLSLKEALEEETAQAIRGLDRMPPASARPGAE